MLLHYNNEIIACMEKKLIHKEKRRRQKWDTFFNCKYLQQQGEGDLIIHSVCSFGLISMKLVNPHLTNKYRLKHIS